jgi:hypothetical protein
MLPTAVLYFHVPTKTVACPSKTIIWNAYLGSSIHDSLNIINGKDQFIGQTKNILADFSKHPG